MYYFLSILGLLVTGQVVKSESGDCAEFPSIPNQNLLFNESLEVDPCGVTTKAAKCLDNETETCTLTSLDPLNSPYGIAVGQQPSAEAIILKVDLSIPSDGEFFVEVYPSKEDGEFNASTILGYFEDTLYENCSSYACCNSDEPSLRNVVRKCPTSVPQSDDKSMMTAYSYLWHAPTDYVGFVIFVGYFFKSNSEHWAQVTSEIIQLALFVDESDQILNDVLNGTQDDSENSTTDKNTISSTSIPETSTTTPEPEPEETKPPKRLKATDSDEDESGSGSKRRKNSHTHSKVELLGVDIGL